LASHKYLVVVHGMGSILSENLIVITLWHKLVVGGVSFPMSNLVSWRSLGILHFVDFGLFADYQLFADRRSVVKTVIDFNYTWHALTSVSLNQGWVFQGGVR